MRRWVPLAAVLLLAACGDRSGPTSPGPGADPPLHLTSGSYTLAVDVRGAGSASTPCGSGLPTTRATLPVLLQRGESDLTVEPQMAGSSLRLRLQVSGDDRLISGTIFGAAIADDGVSIDVFGSTAADPALVSGRANPDSVQGTIIGQLKVGGASCAGGNYSWQLTPRAPSRSA
jgi:hypothetical protein